MCVACLWWPFSLQLGKTWLPSETVHTRVLLDRSVIRMPVEVLWIPSCLRNVSYRSPQFVNLTYRCKLYLSHLRHVVLIIDAISKKVAKVPQSSFQPIGGALFLCFFKGGRFAFAILYVAIPNILLTLNMGPTPASQGCVPREMSHLEGLLVQ
jgi:hypothetical protein